MGGNGRRRVDPGAVDTLRADLRGEVVAQGDPSYDQARAVYNAMIDKHPALVARCHDAADVIASVRFGRDQGLDIAVRSGGHNGAGFGTLDDGLVIDLSGMRGVRVDPDAATAQVAGGTQLGEVDHATHAFGMAAPFGIISTTGVGGLTLGGGVGHLSRRAGLSIDNVLEADVVLADGSFVKAGPDEHDDLYWALRGGGGNFGIVTSFSFGLHPISTVVAGPTLWHLEDAADVLRFYREFIVSAPEELNGFFAFVTVPPGPPFPEELHLKKMCGIVWCFTGPPEKVDEVLAPVRDVGTVAMWGLMPMPLPVIQSAFDALYPPGDQWYWRGEYFDRISDEAIDLHVEHGARLPSMKSTMHLYPVDGAAARPANDDTAWAYRDAKWAGVFAGVDPDPSNAEAVSSWAREYSDALRPHSMGGGYVNFMMDEGQERVRATYRGNYDRLTQVKRTYDPDNVFHVNQNIAPAG